MKQKGFSLIEILVALSIISITLAALIKSEAQSVKNLSYFQQKFFSNLVISNLAIEKRLTKKRSIGFANDTYKLANNTWYYQTHTQQTSWSNIVKISLSVFKDKQQMKNKSPLSQLDIYVLK